MKLDTELLSFVHPTTKVRETWTLGDAVRGTQIFGGIGSGKTSGSGNTLAKAFLEKGFGGLVLCAKPDEKDNWIRLAEEAGRKHDLKIIGEPKQGEPEYFFNPLAYEAKRVGGGETFNLVNLFMQIYQMGRVISGEGLSSGGERFWDTALKRCISRIIDLLKLADHTISIENMYRLISESLSAKEIEYFQQLRSSDDYEDGYDKISEWAKFNFYVDCIFRAKTNLSKSIEHNEEESPILLSLKKQHRTVTNYFEREFSNLAERTKTIIIESFLDLMEPFQSGILQRYFSGNTTIFPEETFENGKIIVLNFPVKNYLDSGVYAQGIFKLLWQQAIERRIYNEANDIPAFLWVDESQLFLSSYDQIYQTTARSAGACTVFLTQNISNYYSAIGGKNPTAKVDSLLANLSTKIFHSNNDAVTNEWASKTIGKAFRVVENFNVGEKISSGGSKQFHFQVLPVEYTVLRSTLNKKHQRLEFDAVITVSDKRWSDSKNYLKYTFTRKLRNNER